MTAVKKKSITGPSNTDFDGLCRLVEVCGNSSVTGIVIGDIQIDFHVEGHVEYVEPSEVGLPEDVRPCPDIDPVDTENNNVSIEDEDFLATAKDAIEAATEDLETLMISDPEKYEEVIASLQNTTGSSDK
jgi:hypothetical protein